MKKVSVIIPVYNVEEYLEECMESVIHQTLKEIEILCVNDGSTDHSLQILEQYAKKDDRIRIISQKNGGYGKAMNQGLDAASGEYIGIVESDDYADPEMFEEMYNVASSNQLDVVKSGFYYYYSIPKERNEKEEKFQAKLKELLALAKKKKNVLEYQEISDFFQDIL